MNTYKTQFSSECPVNGDWIVYSLTIESRRTITAEAIAKATESVEQRTPKLLHEGIAEMLVPLGGRQTLEAQHRGVHITTVRGHNES